MKIAEVISFLAREYPPAQAMDWDNPGLQVGRAERPVQKIMVALDATLDVIRQCAGWGAQLLVTHHPLLLSGARQISDANLSGRRILALAESGIAHYAMHTNYDVTTMGDLAAQALGLTQISVLEPTGTDASGNPIGIGRIGELPEQMSAKECCALVKDAFGLSSVRLFGASGRTDFIRPSDAPDEGRQSHSLSSCSPAQSGREDSSDLRSGAACDGRSAAIISSRARVHKEAPSGMQAAGTDEISSRARMHKEAGVRRIAVSPGSGKSMIAPALRAGADLLVTGDIGHHDGIDAVDNGLLIIDAGHYGVEHIFVAQMLALLQEQFPGIEVRAAEQTSPFEVL